MGTLLSEPPFFMLFATAENLWRENVTVSVRA